MCVCMCLTSNQKLIKVIIMKMGWWLKVSSDRLEKLGIKFSTSLFYMVGGYIHYTTAASSAFNFVISSN